MIYNESQMFNTRAISLEMFNPTHTVLYICIDSDARWFHQRVIIAERTEQCLTLLLSGGECKQRRCQPILAALWVKSGLWLAVHLCVRLLLIYGNMAYVIVLLYCTIPVYVQYSYFRLLLNQFNLCQVHAYMVNKIYGVYT